LNEAEYVPAEPLPATAADAAAVLFFTGFCTNTKTAVPFTLPEAAVTAPETVKLPEPVTVVGETATVTESEAAVAVDGMVTAARTNSATVRSRSAFIPISFSSANSSSI
jgi:hypothetical protein